MKVLLLLSLCIVAARAGVLSKVPDRFIPSFATGYIIKGQDAAPHSAPYIVSIGMTAVHHSHMCGGTIIDKNWVVTAAHCVSKAQGMSIVAGLHVRTDFDEKVQKRVVDYGKRHELYSGGVGPNDIALLHVSKPFEINEYVKPARLPQLEQIHEGETHLYGWGQPKAFHFTAAKTLQTVQTEIVEWNQCKELLPENAPLAESNVCSDSLQQGISACNGDSGGPLVKKIDSDTVELIGIVSWGYIPCGWGNLPSIYTRVSAFVDWIENIQDAYDVLY